MKKMLNKKEEMNLTQKKDYPLSERDIIVEMKFGIYKKNKLNSYFDN